MSTKYVVLHESADDARTMAPIHFPAHRARWQEFRERGELLLIGAFSDLSGAVGVISTREAAEDFVKGDPIRVAWRCEAWHIGEWNEAVGG